MGNDAQSASPKPAVFRTAFGLPLYLVGSAFVLTFINGTLNGTLLQSVLLQVPSAAMLMIMVYFMLSTRYRVQGGVLDVRMGPFNRRIDIESISTIYLKGETFRGRLYGLGTDLVGIDYEGGSVSITPKDVDGFLATIGFCRTESEDVVATR